MQCSFGKFSVAMITPFHHDGSLDFESVKRLVEHLVSQGCDSLVVSGTTGEAPATHLDEKTKLLLTVRETAGAEVKIIAGVSSNDTAHSLAMTKEAQQAGADGLLVCAPYYNRPSQEGIFDHFKAIHDSSSLPILVYDIPCRTGVSITDETWQRLAGLERVRGVKDATGNVAKGISRMRQTGLEWYSGDDSLNLYFLAAGASGVISVVGHLQGRRISRLIAAVAAGDLEQARQLDQELEPLNRGIMGSGQGATYTKQALFELGVIENPRPRLPLTVPGEKAISGIRAMLRHQGLLP